MTIRELINELIENYNLSASVFIDTSEALFDIEEIKFNVEDAILVAKE